MDSVIVTALAVKLGFGALACALGAFTYAYPRWRGTRIQADDRLPDKRELVRRQRVTLRNLALILVLIACGMLVSGFVELGRPTATVFVLHLAALVFGVDLYEYLLHRAFHQNQWLWRHVHSIHHEVSAPVASDYLYVHPIEAVLVGAGFVVVGAMITLVTGGLCGWSLWMWAAIRLTHALDSHSGVRSKLFNRVPVIAEAERHDLHHSSSAIGNFGSLTLIWDRVFKTRLEAATDRSA